MLRRGKGNKTFALGGGVFMQGGMEIVLFFCGTHAAPRFFTVLGFSLKPLIFVAPRDGLEPPTQWLTATCSTD